MSFQQALSGLNASSKGIDIVTNNIANSGTVGFKSSQGHFADVFAASLQAAGSSQVGIGVSVTNVAQQFTQGNITATNNPLDIAVNGAGFFRMEDASGAQSYTRNGQFSVDKNGFMVNDQGLFLSGFQGQNGTIVRSTPVPIFLDPSDLAAVATGTSGALDGFEGVRGNFNLDSRSLPPTVAWPVASAVPGPLTIPADAYNYSSALTIYDSLGNPHTMSLYYVKVSGSNPVPPAPNTSAWDVHVVVDGTQEANISFDGVAQDPLNPKRIVFDSTGQMDTTIVGNSSWNIQVNLDGVTTDLQAADVAAGLPARPNNAAKPIIGVSPAVGPAVAGATDGFKFDLTGTTSFGSVNGVNRLEQDGYSSGRLTGVAIADDGTVTGRYSNGQAKDLAQVVLVNFTNPNGLKPIGGNQWLETSASGAGTVGAPGTSSLGVLQSSAVEESNTDLTKELVDMIVQQRSYQANAQSIKTQDSILNTLVNLR